MGGGGLVGTKAGWLRTTNASPRGQTRRSVSIGEKMYTSLRCKLRGFVPKPIIARKLS